MSSDGAFLEIQRRSRIKTHLNPKSFIVYYLGHWLSVRSFCSFHLYAFDLIAKSIKRSLTGATGVGLRELVIAPRGIAKSTLLTKLFIIMVLVFKLKNFVVIISDTEGQSKKLLEGIKFELEHNDLLKRDFPDSAGISKTGFDSKQQIWNKLEIITAANCRVSAYGVNTQIRGASHLHYRPDLIILDDVENWDLVISEVRRNNLKRKFWDTIVPLGSLDGSHDIFVVGTLLHKNGLVGSLMSNHLFNYKLFSLVKKFPKNIGLWHKFSKIWRTENKDKAGLFYKNNKKKMDEGAEVLWEQGLSLVNCLILWVVDELSFWRERQNKPRHFQGQRLFATTYSLLSNKVRDGGQWFCFCDPASGRGSLAANSFVLIAYYFNGVLYIEEENYNDEDINHCFNFIIDRHKYYVFANIGFEANAFQYVGSKILLEKGQEQNISLPVTPIDTTTKKDLRIIGLQPYLQNRSIVVNERCIRLLTEIESFQGRIISGERIDGLDCLSLLHGFVSMNSNNVGASKKMFF